MGISYNKLWNLMRNNKMKKKDLKEGACLSQFIISKLSNNETVDLKYLMNICKVFHCNIGDLVDYIEDV